MADEISAEDLHTRRRMPVLDSEMAYVDMGEGDPIVFLHGNPTSSYLWRNVIPHLEGQGRILAPDLIGMGDSGKPGGQYRFVDHARYLDAWFEAVGATDRVTFVVHDWGSALAFHWGNRHRDAVKGYAYMEAIVRPYTWEQWPPAAVFRRLRSEEGESMCIEGNYFVEVILKRSVLRGLGDEEMAVYRRPYADPQSRRPTLTWPREIPIAGEPADVVEIARSYSEWMAQNDLPKLLVNTEPGAILTGSNLEYVRSWRNQREITVKGSHFVQEDSPHEIGRAVSEWVASL